MAKYVSDREDLIRDATNYVLRCEFRLPDTAPLLFAGCREGGAWSLYWGQDDVLQWNAAHEVRRGFCQDRMLASYLGQLHFLDRPAGGRARLTRSPLSSESQSEILNRWAERLRLLREAMAQGTFALVRQAPADEDVPAALDQWLTHLALPLALAQHPGL